MESQAQPGDVLAGGGEMGSRMRAMDWTKSPLGPPNGWSQALKTSVRIMLTSRQPMFVWWGKDLINLYNDAYRDILGGKHPQALGQPAATVWQEIWDQVGPRAQSAMLGNEGTYDEALLLIMERHGYPEETYYTFSYSPVPNDAGTTGGILCANTNDTQRIIGERQLSLLHALAAKAAEARSVEDACRLSASALETNPWDLPFVLIYLVDREKRQAVLAGRSGIAPGHAAAPEVLPLEEGAVWPCAQVLQTDFPTVISELPESLGELPTGSWPQPPHKAVVAPIVQSGETGQAAILIAALNPYRLFDTDYQRFLRLISSQLAAAIGDAEAYEKERERAETLAELDRAKTAFFSNVSHEFRTPLTLLLGPLEDALAGADGKLPAEERELLEVAHRNAMRLLRLVNTLLDFSRIEAGRTEATYEKTDLAMFTADLASTFRSAMERAGLHFEVHCPALPDGIQVYVDREMWEKIVLNLLSNAFKFTFEGEIAVQLDMTPDSKAVELTIRDTGAGIPSAELPQMFERFHRLHGARSRTHEGTGIGLALIQELVTLHGGSVSVQSEVDHGSKFTVTIPTGRVHLSPDRIRGEESAPTTVVGAAPYVEEAIRWLPDTIAESDNGLVSNEEVAGVPESTRNATRDAASSIHVRGRILLADDNADMREYVARLLGQHYEVEACRDGAAALAAARERPPDLVLSDVMMPNLDGFGLLRTLRENPLTQHIPVIMLSARAGEESRVEGLGAGADDYLVKPFSARELLARVGAHLALAKARQAAVRNEQMARAEVERERSHLRRWLQQAPAAIAVLRGPEHVFELANQHYVQIFGAHREYIGLSARAVFSDVDQQDVWRLLDQVYAEGTAYVGLERPVRFQSRRESPIEERFYNFVFQPIMDVTEKTEGIFVHAVDVTDQVRARQSLEAEIAERVRAETRLDGERAVLEMIARGCPLGETLEALAHLIESEAEESLCSILVLDRGGRSPSGHQTASPETGNLRYGAAPSLPEAYNRAIDGIAVGPAVGSCGTAAFRDDRVVVFDIATDPLWEDFRDLALPHGLRACWSTPIHGSDGRVLGTFAMYHRIPREPQLHEMVLVDVLTYLASVAIERHHSEQELSDLFERERAARASAEKAVRARDEFLSIASHELRTPLTVVKGGAQMLRRSIDRDALDPKRLGQSLESILRASDRLSRLVDDLLNVSRLQGGQLALRLETLDFVQLVHEIATRHVEQQSDVPVQWPELSDEPVLIEVDSIRVEQVIDNVLSNAVKYSPAGGAVDIRMALDTDGVTLEVRDSGIGLPEGAEESIFEPFGRASNAVTLGFPGTGLGLYVSRRLTEMHGGRLWAESEGEGRGTTVRLRLPIGSVATATRGNLSEHLSPNA